MGEVRHACKRPRGAKPLLPVLTLLRGKCGHVHTLADDAGERRQQARRGGAAVGRRVLRMIEAAVRRAAWEEGTMQVKGVRGVESVGRAARGGRPGHRVLRVVEATVRRAAWGEGARQAWRV